MKCRQCSNPVRVNFSNGYCSSTCAGFKPREVKRKAGFKVEDDKVVYVDAGVEPFDMPAHYLIEDATPENLDKRHKEKTTATWTRAKLITEFKELRGMK